MSQHQQEEAFILYVDHQGHPAPLTEQFHATASRKLSSTVQRYPISTTTEVDSAYCPQCLSFYDAARGAELGFCPHQATCQRCPICLSVASVHTGENENNGALECFYQCGGCDWTSKQCGVRVPLPTADGGDNPPGRVELARAAEDLVQAVKERRSIEPSVAWQQKLAKEWDEGRTSSSFAQQHSVASRRADEWSVATLDAQRQIIEAQWTADHSNYELPSGCNRVTIQDILKRSTAPDDSESQTADPRSLLAYQLQPHTVDVAALLPLPLALETRQSRRCRAELSAGRPGILLKPKLNPQEGDSSLPTGHGQWHRKVSLHHDEKKYIYIFGQLNAVFLSSHFYFLQSNKDSSAIHVIPRVQVIQHHPPSTETSNKRVFLLKVANPTLGTVRLRMAKSDYQGEVNHWDEFSHDLKTTTKMPRVLVDTLNQTFMDVQLNADIDLDISNNTDTLVELLSAEDSIIELGARANDTPAEVMQWKPGSAATSSDTAATMMSIRLVAKSASDAWFELVLPVSPENDDASNAVPLALQVNLGNGSWESSLIPTQPEKKDDRVTFDLVLAWKKLNKDR